MGYQSIQVCTGDRFDATKKDQSNMLKSLVFCVLLWHKVYEINGHADPVSTDEAEQAESKGILNSPYAALSNRPLFERVRLSSNFKPTGEEIVTDYVMAKGIGAFKVHRIQLTWNSARQICIEEGGHLAIIRSTSEANIVKQLMIETSIDEAWVGLHDQFEERDWVSVLDEPIGEIGWEYWSRNFYPNPDYRYNNMHCARIVKSDGGLRNEYCRTARPFICKISIS